MKKQIIASLVMFSMNGYIAAMGGAGMSVDETIGQAQEANIERQWRIQAQKDTDTIQVQYGDTTLDIPIYKYKTVKKLKDMLEDEFDIDNDFELYDINGHELDEDDKLSLIQGPIHVKIEDE